MKITPNQINMKTHWKKEFNYEYMGSYSLPDGKDVVLTIKETKKEIVIGTNGKKEECFVCYFKESDKPMILNRTNCKTIERVHKTPYIEDWPGIVVQIGIDKVNAFGEVVDALRIRNIKPAPKVAPDYTGKINELRACKTLAELHQLYVSLTPEEKAATIKIKDELKAKLS